jgi:hypothetical protein
MAKAVRIHGGSDPPTSERRYPVPQVRFSARDRAMFWYEITGVVVIF